MPPPMGQYSIGTRTFLLVDEGRIDDASPIKNGYRTMSIQVWYPATVTGKEELTSYIRSDIRNEMEKLGGPPAFFFGHLDLIQTYSYWDAENFQLADPFPVIIYSPSGNASMHKILFEELASQGYVVVSVSHPHWSNVIVDNHGNVIMQGGVGDRFNAWFEEDNSSAVQTAKGQILSSSSTEALEQAQISLNRRKPIAISELRQWSEDIGFVIDHLSELNQPQHFFDGNLDLNRIGVMGFSLGGANAGQFCVTDSRCQAGINVDGFMFGDILERNLKVPFMFIQSENPNVKPGLTGALFYERAETSAYMVQIAGATHGDLGAPMPSGEPIFVQLGVSTGNFPDGGYLAQIMNEYFLAFFDKHLRNLDAPILRDTLRFPEVMLLKKE